MCVEHQDAFKVLRPQLGPLMTGVIFPQLCFTGSERELWDSEPVEYIRKVRRGG
jgi:hypothetical protein